MYDPRSTHKCKTIPMEIWFRLLLATLRCFCFGKLLLDLNVEWLHKYDKSVK